MTDQSETHLGAVVNLSEADRASAAECAKVGQHQTATDVTGRAWCVVCGKACS